MADYTYIASTGTIVPDTNTTLVTVQNIFKSVFGQDLVIDPETPQGILISALTLVLTTMQQNNALVANQFNPNLAGGVFLNALWALTGGQASPGTYTTVSATLTGVPGTVVPSNARAKISSGEEFRLTSSVTLTGGTGTGVFQAVNPGPIACPSNALTTIVSTGVAGWETVNNPAAQTTLGSLAQSDFSARVQRNETLAIQGMGLIEAIYGRIKILPGVQDVYAQENTNSTTQVINSISMVSHSIYVCVDGGTDADIAATLTEVKNGGCAYNNGTPDPSYHRAIAVTNTLSGQTITVKFDRPVLQSIFVSVTVRNNNSVHDLVKNVKQAILDYANGLFNNEPGFAMGQPVSPLELAGAVNQRIPQVFVSDLLVGTTAPATSRETLVLPVYTKAIILNESSITVTVI